MITEAPEIELDASLRKGLAVRAGCPIRLFAVIRGRPAPKVTWKRLGLDNVVRRGHVDQVDSMSFLVIPESTREDSGRYSLTLSNSAGEKAVFVRVKVLGKSGNILKLLVVHGRTLLSSECSFNSVQTLLVPSEAWMRPMSQRPLLRSPGCLQKTMEVAP